jgi:putative peptide zinc metalloprotease protein
MLSRAALTPWLRRPAVVAIVCLATLAALLSGGLVVARAVDGAPAADTTAAEPSPAAGSTSGGDDNVAAAVNTKDGKTVYAIRLKIVQTSADTVDSANVAAAVASCNDCTTVAIAFEGVIIAGPATTITPTNLALAYNVNCSGCTTVAEAYQKVVQTSTRVRITKEGRREIAAVRKELNGLRHSDVPYDDIVAQVAVLEQRFAAVLTNELVPVGRYKDAPPADATDVSDTPPSADPSETAAATDSPAATPSESPSESPSAEPSSTATSPESATPSPEPSTSTSTEPSPSASP